MQGRPARRAAHVSAAWRCRRSDGRVVQLFRGRGSSGSVPSAGKPRLCPVRAAGGCFQARPLRSVTDAAGPLQRLILCCGRAAGAGERERGSRTCTVRGPPDSGSIPQHGGRHLSAPGRALGGGGMRTHVHVCTVCMRVHICTHVCTHVHVSAYVHCTHTCMRVCGGAGVADAGTNGSLDPQRIRQPDQTPSAEPPVPGDPGVRCSWCLPGVGWGT